MPEPPKVSAPNTLSLSQLVTGCKVFVARPSEGPSVARKAEILSSREKKLSRAEKKGTAPEGKQTKEEDKVEYYVHYVEFNKVRSSFRSSQRLTLTPCHSDWTNG